MEGAGRSPPHLVLSSNLFEREALNHQTAKSLAKPSVVMQQSWNFYSSPGCVKLPSDQSTATTIFADTAQLSGLVIEGQPQRRRRRAVVVG